MSTTSGMHPETLIWYACGRLDPDEIERVERHLAVCEDCRDECQSLRSIARSLRRADDAGHPACADLVAYHGDGRSRSPLEAVRISAHLRECAACQADLARLDRAAAIGRRRWDDGAAIARIGSLSPPLVLTGSSWSRGVRRLSAAAAVVLLALTLPPRPTVSTATFVPVLRGPDAARRIVGLGPSRISLLLPSQAPPATYTMSVTSLGDPAGVLSLRTGPAGPAAPIVLEIGGFPKPGRYRVEIVAAGRAERYAYTFEVVRWP